MGKTHLLHATGHHARARLGGNLRVLYLTSERFTNELIASIRSGKMEEFRDRYRTVDILMIGRTSSSSPGKTDARRVLPHLQPPAPQASAS